MMMMIIEKLKEKKKVKKKSVILFPFVGFRFFVSSLRPQLDYFFLFDLVPTLYSQICNCACQNSDAPNSKDRRIDNRSLNFKRTQN